MVKSWVFRGQETASVSGEKMAAGDTSAPINETPSTSEVVVTPNMKNEPTTKVAKEPPKKKKVTRKRGWTSRYTRYYLYIAHSGMRSAEGEELSIKDLDYKFTKSYTTQRLRAEAAKHIITHLKVEGSFPPDISSLAPDITDLCVREGESDFLTSLSGLERLQTLDLSYNKFRSVESLNVLSSLTLLTELNLQYCGLQELPASLSGLERLETLDLWGNKFRSLETLNVLSSLKTLTVLVLGCCGFQELPASLSGLERLQKLTLSYNKFRSVESPDVLLSLTSLTELNLGSCELQELPTSLSGLERLQKLDLGFNEFRSSESLNVLSSLTSLTELNLGSCELQELPTSLSGLERLQTLDLWNNKFRSVESLNVLSSLTSLTELDLWSCGLQELPSSLSGLERLQKLTLPYNKFKSVESLNVLSSLTSLTELHLGYCGLQELPTRLEKLQKLYLTDNKFISVESLDVLSSLKSLTELYLGSCGLQELPASLSELDNLKILYLGDNKLVSLPPVVCKLKSLEKLDLEWNSHLTSLDPGIQHMRNLRTLYLRFGGSLESPPSHIREAGIDAIKDFYKNSHTPSVSATTLSLDFLPSAFHTPLPVVHQQNNTISSLVTNELQSGGWRSSPPRPQTEALALVNQASSGSARQSEGFLGQNYHSQSCSEPAVFAQQTTQPPYTERVVPPQQTDQPPYSERVVFSQQTGQPSYFGFPQLSPWIPTQQFSQAFQLDQQPAFSLYEPDQVLSAALLHPPVEASSAGEALPSTLPEPSPPTTWLQLRSPSPVVASSSAPPPLESVDLTQTVSLQQSPDTEPSTSFQQSAPAAPDRPPLVKPATYIGAIRGQTIKLMVSSDGTTEIFQYRKKDTVEEFNTLLRTELGTECSIRDTDGSLYNRKTELPLVEKPFLVRIGDIVNTIPESEEKKRKHSDSSDDEEEEEDPDRSYRSKRKVRKPLFGIVSSAQQAVALMTYIHKQITEKSLTIHKALHLPEVKKDRKTVDRFRNIYYLHEVNPEKLEELEREWKTNKKFGGLAGLDETARQHLDIDEVKRKAEQGELTIFGEKALTG